MCVLTISKMYLRVAFNLSGSFFYNQIFIISQNKHIKNISYNHT